MKTTTMPCGFCGNSFSYSNRYAAYRLRAGKSPPKYCSRECAWEDSRITSKEFEAVCIRRYMEGESTIEIGKSMNVSWATIRNVLIRNGIKMRSKSERMSGDRNPTRGKGHTQETKDKLRDISIQYYKDNPEARDRARERTLAQISDGRMPKSNTSIERKMSGLLTEMGVPFCYQYSFGYWVYDFFLPDCKTFIECDGDYWHGNPVSYENLNSTQRNNATRGKQKENYAIKHGYKLIRFWESEINDSLDTVRESVRKIERSKG